MQEASWLPVPEGSCTNKEKSEWKALIVSHKTRMTPWTFELIWLTFPRWKFSVWECLSDCQSFSVSKSWIVGVWIENNIIIKRICWLNLTSSFNVRRSYILSLFPSGFYKILSCSDFQYISPCLLKEIQFSQQSRENGFSDDGMKAGTKRRPLQDTLRKKISEFFKVAFWELKRADCKRSIS